MRSAKMVEDEQWAVIEVSPRSQRVSNIIVDSAVKDPPEVVFEKVTKSNGLTIPISSSASPEPLSDGSPLPNGQTNGTSSKGEEGETKGVNAKVITIEGQTFHIVSATMQVLGLVIDYLKVMVNLSSLNMECMSRLVEFLKVCVHGLKRWSTLAPSHLFMSGLQLEDLPSGIGGRRYALCRTQKHNGSSSRYDLQKDARQASTNFIVALASQSLSIMIVLIPYLRENFRRHLSPKQFVLLTEFDKLRRDYQEHQNEIHSKLINIMGDRLSFHCKALKEVQWDTSGPAEGVPAESPNLYMQGLVRETVTLHKVLSKYLGANATEVRRTC
jgi:vacuolar protein sorting-associated protein 54